jgi:hypothetical protein
MKMEAVHVCSLFFIGILNKDSPSLLCLFAVLLPLLNYERVIGCHSRNE